MQDKEAPQQYEASKEKPASNVVLRGPRWSHSLSQIQSESKMPISITSFQHSIGDQSQGN